MKSTIRFNLMLTSLVVLLLMSVVAVRAAPGHFIAAWGWGVTDGSTAYQICTGPTCQTGIPGGGAGQFRHPSSVAVDDAGNAYVADYLNDRIQQFDSNGNFVRAWGWGVDTGAAAFEICTPASLPCQAGIAGGGAGQFDAPIGVAVDGDGNVYVVEFYNYRVQQFDSSGNFVRTWGWGVNTGVLAFEVCTPASLPCQAGRAGIGAGQLNGPTDVALDGDGNVYVSDSTNNRIQQFDNNANFVRTWGWGVDTGAATFEVCTPASLPCRAGIAGGGAGQFNSPYAVAVGDAGYIHVISFPNNRVQQFDSNANFVRTWGWGVDTGTATFEVCTPASLPCQAGIAGGGAGQLNGPTGVTVDVAGNVYVTDYNNDRIQQFDSGANFVRTWGWGVDTGATAFEVCTPASLPCQAGIAGGGAGQLDGGFGLANDSAGNLYVAGYANDRIQLFQYGYVSATDGNWHTANTWRCNAVPGADSAVFIASGTTVTLDASATCDTLFIEPGGTLIIPAGVTLSVERSVVNQGTIQQTQAVGSGASVEFLHIQDSGASSTQYRGAVVDTSTTSSDLGNVTVSVRGIDQGTGEYCTTTGGSSPAYANRCFEITIDGSDGPADITLYGLTSELYGIAEANLAVYRYEGNPLAWTELSSTNGNDGGNYSYASARTPGFSHFLLGATGNAPTAIQLQESTTQSHSSVLPIATFGVLVVAFSLFIWKRRKFESARTDLLG